MTATPELLLVGAVAAVGVLHTLVPDHWMPIVILARRRGWSRSETALAALRAGAGHAVSTVVLGAALWLAGAEAARHFGRFVDLGASLALIGFGGWIALAAWDEQRQARACGHRHPHQHGHGHHHHRHPDTADPMLPAGSDGAAVLVSHAHRHRHADGRVHVHWHEHGAAAAHSDAVPMHDHRHDAGGRTALLLILGSSPMVEGIPAFFAAAKYGAPLLGAMSAAFAAATIATYLLLCTTASAGLERMQFGAVERHGEIASGALIALVGIVFWLWPVI